MVSEWVRTSLSLLFVPLVVLTLLEARTERPSELRLRLIIGIAALSVLLGIIWRAIRTLEGEQSSSWVNNALSLLYVPLVVLIILEIRGQRKSIGRMLVLAAIGTAATLLALAAQIMGW